MQQTRLLSKAVALYCGIALLMLISSQALFATQELEESFASIWARQAGLTKSYYLEQVDAHNQPTQSSIQVLMNLEFPASGDSKRLNITLYNTASQARIPLRQLNYTALPNQASEDIDSSIRLFSGAIQSLDFVVAIFADGQVSLRVWTGVTKPGHEHERRDLTHHGYYGWLALAAERLEGATIEPQLYNLNSYKSSLWLPESAEALCTAILP